MFKPWPTRYPKHLRMIDIPPADTGGGEPSTDPGTGDAGEHVDWEAKYHDAMKHSREWENRAKANSDAANRLKALEDAKLSETEKLTKRAEAEYLTRWGPGLLRLGAIMSFGGYCVSRPGLLRLGAVVG